MARYIDADELDLEYYDLFTHGTMAVKGVLQIFKDLLDKQPTADVVKVVRCKDCKHKVLTKGNMVMCSKNAQKMECVADWYGLTATNDNNYCSYGEKRSEEE